MKLINDPLNVGTGLRHLSRHSLFYFLCYHALYYIFERFLAFKIEVDLDGVSRVTYLVFADRIKYIARIVKFIFVYGSAQTLAPYLLYLKGVDWHFSHRRNNL